MQPSHTVSQDILNVFKMEEHSNGELSQWTILINLLLLGEGFFSSSAFLVFMSPSCESVLYDISSGCAYMEPPS